MEAEDKADAEQFKQAVLRDAQLHLEVRNDVQMLESFWQLKRYKAEELW